MTGPKILTIDIETSPMISFHWGMWDQNIGLNQIIEPTRVICFAAKWHGEKGKFWSEFHHEPKDMIQAAWDLLNEADIVNGYNSKSFDIPHLQREFLELGLGAPSPFYHVDLLPIARRQFKWPSNKLAYITKALKMEGKVENEGMPLWVKCLARDPKAWADMKKYNLGDIDQTEELFDQFRPWLKNFPHMGLFDSDAIDGCPSCGSINLQKRGTKKTLTAEFQQYYCNDCGAWPRSAKSDPEVRPSLRLTA